MLIDRIERHRFDNRWDEVAATAVRATRSGGTCRMAEDGEIPEVVDDDESIPARSRMIPGRIDGESIMDGHDRHALWCGIC